MWGYALRGEWQKRRIKKEKKLRKVTSEMINRLFEW
jgi:hypothetical protein